MPISATETQARIMHPDTQRDPQRKTCWVRNGIGVFERDRRSQTIWLGISYPEQQGNTNNGIIVKIHCLDFCIFRHFTFIFTKLELHNY